MDRQTDLLDIYLTYKVYKQIQMASISNSVKFFLELSKIQAVMNRRFDNGLGGLGFNEFIILYNLSQAENKQMRRIDLAEKIGLTASGVTRLLLPMEKVGLVLSGSLESDARVRSVQLASGGERKLAEALERAEFLSQEILTSAGIKKIDTLTDSLIKLAGRV